MTLALFPLPLFLLPGGITKLRIFEPRYIRLVKESCDNGQGFVLAMKNADDMLPYGTLVTITDFETLPDGLLGITIQANHRVEIFNIFQEKDGLWKGDIELLLDWSLTQESAGLLGEQLVLLFASHPLHAAQYHDELDFNNLTWVCQRWLEVLPLSNEQQQWFLSQNSYKAARDFITDILCPHDKSLN